MTEQIYNHIKLSSLIYNGNTKKAIQSFTENLKTYHGYSPTQMKNYLTSLNHGIYNYILFTENISLHHCCCKNDQIIQTMSTNTFLDIGLKIINSYGVCSDYLIEKYSNTYVKQAISYIHKHLSEPIKLDDVCHEVGMSRCYFCHLFHKEVGQSFSEYILKHRISTATRLLNTTDLTIEEIGLHCGFQTTSYFSSSYKKITGLTPSSIRKK